MPNRKFTYDRRVPVLDFNEMSFVNPFFEQNHFEFSNGFLILYRNPIPERKN
jgi:hypothetical protein